MGQKSNVLEGVGGSKKLLEIMNGRVRDDRVPCKILL